MAMNYETYDKQHAHFGGTVYPSDFNTETRRYSPTCGSDIAKRIEADYRRDRKLFINYIRKTEESNNGRK